MKISILGTGAFGMALASVFHDNKCSVKMWTNNEDEMNWKPYLDQYRLQLLAKPMDTTNYATAVFDFCVDYSYGLISYHLYVGSNAYGFSGEEVEIIN